MKPFSLPRFLAVAAACCGLILQLSSCATTPKPAPTPTPTPAPAAGDLYRSILTWQKVPTTSPDYAQAQQNIAQAEAQLSGEVNREIQAANAALRAGSVTVAVSSYKRAADLDPRRADLAQNAADLEAAAPLVARHDTLMREKRGRDDLVGALREAEIMLTLAPEHGPAATAKAELAARLKELAEASFKDGLGKLQSGDEKGAKRSLLTALYYDPSHQGARDYFFGSRTGSGAPLVSPTDYIVHVIQKGETLSILAEKYYGDKFKYQIIASFNNMNDPTKVEVGQKIKVPNMGAMPAGPGPMPSPAPPSSSEYTASLLDQAKSLMDAGQYDESIEESKKVLGNYPDNKTARGILVESYYRKGADLLKSKLFEKSLEILKRVIDLVPDYRDTKELLAKAKKGMEGFIDDIYKEGITLYRDQKLNEALEKWREVLRLDPAHDGAKKYSEKAQQLLDKIKEKEREKK